MKSKGAYLTVAGLSLAAALGLGGPSARGQQADKTKNIGTVVYDDSSHQYRFLVDRRMAEGLEDFGVRVEDSEGNVVFKCDKGEYASPETSGFVIKRVPENELQGDPKKMAKGGKVVITAYRKDGENFVEIRKAVEYVDEGDKFPIPGEEYGNMNLDDETDPSREFVEGGMNSGSGSPEGASGNAQPGASEDLGGLDKKVGKMEKTVEELNRTMDQAEKDLDLGVGEDIDSEKYTKGLQEIDSKLDEMEGKEGLHEVPKEDSGQKKGDGVELPKPPAVPSQPKDEPVVPTEPTREQLLEKAKQMGAKRPEIFNGYAVDMEGYSISDLKETAGLKSSKMDVYGSPEKPGVFYGADTSVTDEEALAVLKEADIDSDKIITAKEAENIREKAIAEAFSKKEKSALEKAREAGATNPVVLGNGYVAFDEATAILLSNVSGVWTGSVRVKGRPEEYKLEGNFKRVDDPEAFDRSCANADEKEDGVITAEEADKYLKEVVKNYFNRILTTDVRLADGHVLGAPYLDTLQHLTTAEMLGKIDFEDALSQADLDGDRKITPEEAKALEGKYFALAEEAKRAAEAETAKLAGKPEDSVEPPKAPDVPVDVPKEGLPKAPDVAPPVVPPVEPVAPVEPKLPEAGSPVVPKEDTGLKTEDEPELPATEEPLPKDYQDIVDEITYDIRKYKSDLDRMKEDLLNEINPNLRAYAIRKSNEIKNYIRKTLEEEREKRAKKDKRLIERIDNAAEEELGKD